MHSKMSAALNKFFTPRLEDEEAKLQRKYYNGLLFLRFFDYEPLHRCPEQMSSMAPSLIWPSWSSQVTL